MDFVCQIASAKLQAIEAFSSLSAHFEPTCCFAQVASVVSSNCDNCARRRALEKGSIPTRDAVVSISPGPLTSREKRQVSIKDLVISLCSFKGVDERKSHVNWCASSTKQGFKNLILAREMEFNE